MKKKIGKLLIGTLIVAGLLFGAYHVEANQQVASDIVPMSHCDPGQPGGC